MIGACRSPGNASIASADGSAARLLRSDAKRGAVCRAPSHASATGPKRPAPSVTCPPFCPRDLCRGAPVSRPRRNVSATASAMKSFMRGGYAAACAARLRPAPSRPCARCSCGSVPCAQSMAPSGSIASRSSAECAIVVYFCTGAPKLHCAKVRVVASAASSAAAMCAFNQIGAWSANFGHHAADRLSPRSAGFSSAQAAPAACAAPISSADHRASSLCLVRYARHSGGAFDKPLGRRLVRSCGRCATE